MDDEESEGEEDAEEAPKTKKAAPKKKVDESRKVVPEGTPNALHDLKVLFTGTLDTDRKTSEAAAVKFGATVVNKLEETDYIILGKRPGECIDSIAQSESLCSAFYLSFSGDKKIAQIEKEGLETISEPQFLEMLETGVPKEKRDRMAAKAAKAAKAAEADQGESAQPAKKKQKK